MPAGKGVKSYGKGKKSGYKKPTSKPKGSMKKGAMKSMRKK